MENAQLRHVLVAGDFGDTELRIMATTAGAHRARR